jgi:hypothetical protein
MLSSALSAQAQEILALLFVALVAGIALWRRWRRKQSAAGCNQCGDKRDAPKEKTIRFYRRGS